MKKLKKQIAVFLLLLTIINLIPINASAHNAYFLRSVFNEENKLYSVSIIHDKLGITSNEDNHIENKRLFATESIDGSNEDGEWKNVTNTDSYRNYGAIDKGLDLMEKTDILSFVSSQKLNYFNFPSKEAKMGSAIINSDATNKNHATSKDAERAVFISQFLSSNMNDAILFVNNGYHPESLDELKELSNDISSSNSFSRDGIGYQVQYGVASDEFKESMKSIDLLGYEYKSSSNYITITRSQGGEVLATKTFLFRLAKGYKNISSLTEGSFNSNVKVVDDRFKSEYSDDLNFITWNHLMYQASALYEDFGITQSNAVQMRDVSKIEQWLVSIFENLFNGIRNSLGLYSISELVFNSGIRGTNTWWFGVMSNEWRENIMIFYNIFLAIAISIITFSIVLNIIKLNVDTMNLETRIDGKTKIQNLFVAGFLLSFLSPIIATLLRMNFALVDVFKAVAPNFSDLSGIMNYSNGLSGILMQFVYFAIALVYNFTYIMRALSVALLVITAPFFVATIAIGGKYAGSFTAWLKELVSNIFIQSIHALILGYIFTISLSARGIEGLVVLIGAKMLGDFLAQLMLGSSTANKLGVGAFSTVGGLAMAGAGFASGAIGGATATDKQKGSGSGKYKGSGKGGSQDSEADISPVSTDLNKNESLNLEKDSGVSSSSGGSDGLSGGSGEAKLSPFEKLGNKIQDSEAYNGIFNDEKIAKRVDTAQNIGKVGLGAMGTAMGGALMVASGGDPSINGMGRSMAKSSTGALNNGLSSFGFGDNNSGDNSPRFAKQPSKKNVDKFYDQGTFDPTLNGNNGGFAHKETGNPLEMDSLLGYQEHGNGDTTLFKDANVMAKQGVTDARMNGDDALLTYDESRLGTNQVEQLQQMEAMQNAYNSSTDGSTRDNLKKEMNSMGFKSINRGKNGTNVLYNEEGLEAMNLKDIRKSGNKFIEKKSPNQKATTERVPNIQPSKATQNQIKPYLNN